MRGKESTNLTLFGRMKRALAYYPLTMYFGLALLAFSALFLWLYLQYDFQFDLQRFIAWLHAHQTPLLLGATGILSMTLIGSAVAYRQVDNLSKEDYVMWLQQRSTRTFFPFFVPLHDWFRLRFAVYRWWHTQVFSSTIHILILLLFVTFSANVVTHEVREQTLISPTSIGCSGGVVRIDDGWRYAFGIIDPVLAAGVIKEFIVTGISSPTTVGTANSVTVTAKDCDNLTKTDYVGTIHFVSSDGSATLPSNYTFVGGDSGVHTFTNGVTFATAGTQSVTVNDTVDTSAVGSQTGITVNSAAAATLQVTAITDPVTAGTASSVTVTAKTSGGATATGYTGTVTFSSSDVAAVLPSNYTFVAGDNGVHTFTNGVTLKTVGERSVTATDTVTSSITGNQGSITVTPAAASTLTVTGITTPTIAGTVRSAIVTARDAYSNTAAGYTGTITFTSSDAAATLPSNYTFVGGDAGTHTFTNGVTLKTASTQSVTATDTVTGSITGNQSAITVTAGPATSLTVAGITSPTIAGVARSVTVTVKDSYSNTATGYTGTISFSSSDSQATLPADYTFVGGDAGTHTFGSGVVLKTAGTRSVTATDIITVSLSGTQSSITVVAADTTTFAVSGINTPITAGSPALVIVTAKDSYGNTTTGYTGTVGFSSSDTQAELPTNYTFISSDAGSHNFNGGVTLKTAGTQSVTAADVSTKSITGNQTGIVVTASATVELVLTNVATSTTAGQLLSPTVTLKDVYSNVATSYTGTVQFTSTDSQAALPSSYSFIASDSGTHTFTNQLTLKTAGDKAVTAYDESNRSLTQTKEVVVRPGAVSNFVVSANTPQVVNVGWSETVTAFDAYGNQASSDQKIQINLSASSKAVSFYTTNTYIETTDTYVRTAGAVTIYVKSDAAGTITISATDQENKNGTSGPIVVNTVTPTNNCGKVRQPSLSTSSNSGRLNNEECETGGGSGGSTGGGGSNGAGDPNEVLPGETTTDAINVIQQIQAAIRNDEIIRTVRNIGLALAPIIALLTLAPVATALTTAAVTHVATGLPFINLSLVGASQRRHRRKWGMVKNARNQLPIGGVFIELWTISGKKISQALTDQTGRYGFIVDTPGKYEIRVKNPLYAPFTSAPLDIINPRADIVMADTVLTPLGAWQENASEKITRILKFLSLLNIIYWPVLVFGSVAALYVFGQQINLINAAVVGLYLLLWSAKLLEYDYYRPFGLVIDRETGEPQAGVVVQLTAKEPGARTRVISTITDKRGRFLFVVRPRHYHLVAAKEGYAPLEKDLIGSDINVTVKLDKAKL